MGSEIRRGKAHTLSKELRHVAALFNAPQSWLLLTLPTAAVCRVLDANDLWVFIFAGLAIIPLAWLLGLATEHLSRVLGTTIGGLLNATLGNVSELILGLLAVWKGPAMYPLIKASLTGSIIANVLLVLGTSILAGGLRYEHQRFNRAAAGMGATLLALASMGLIVPSLYFHLQRRSLELSAADLETVHSLSVEIALVLAIIYVLSVVYSLRSGRDLVSDCKAKPKAADITGLPTWNWRLAVAVLFVATCGVAWMSWLFVDTVEHATKALGLNQVFVGVIVVAIVANAAEHSTSVLMALHNKLDLAMQLAIGSSIQIALFVAPVLVFGSLLLNSGSPLDLHFTPLEIMAVIFTVGALGLLVQDGETNWMEGVMLLGVYGVLALAFYHVPAIP